MLVQISFFLNSQVILTIIKTTKQVDYKCKLESLPHQKLLVWGCCKMK